MDQIFLVDFCEQHLKEEIVFICLDRECKNKQRFLCKQCQEDNLHQQCQLLSMSELAELRNWEDYKNKNDQLQSNGIKKDFEISYDRIFQQFEKYIEDLNIQMRKYLKLINLRYTNLFQYESRREEYMQQIKESVLSSTPLSLKCISLNDILDRMNQEESIKEEIITLQNNLQIELNDIKQLFENISSHLSFDKVSYNYVSRLESIHNPFVISQSRKIAIANTQKPSQASFHIIEPPILSESSSEITFQIVKKGNLGISLGIISTINQQIDKYKNALGVDRESKYIYQCGNKGNCYLVDNFREGWSDIEGISFDSGDVIQIIYNSNQESLEFNNTTRKTQCILNNIQNLIAYKDYYSFFISSIGPNHEIKILY